MNKQLLLIVAFTIISSQAFAGGGENKGNKDSTQVLNSPSISEMIAKEAVEEEEVEAPSSVERSVAIPDQEPTDLWHRSTLTGNWNGTRDMFGEQGVSFSLGYRGDNTSVVSGGLEKRGSYLHNIDLLIGVDAEKMFEWKGASFLFHAMSNNGGGLSKYIGDAQVASNIDAPKMTKIYQAWLQQNLLDGKLSFLVGLYDLNAEFYVTKPALLFLNSSFGVGKEFAQTGQNGPSIFPNPGAAFRARIAPTEQWSFQFAAIDAVPGSPSDPMSPAFTMNSNEGALVIGEVAFSWGGIEEENIGAGKYTIGAWFYTSPFEEVQAIAATGEGSSSTTNSGMYVMAEQNIYSEQGDAAQGFFLFTRLGFANSRINQYNYNVSAGATYVGPFAGRDADKIGFALTHANNGNYYQQTKGFAGEPFATSELAFEFTYRAQLTPWLVVQPDLQYIIHPGTNPSLENATVFGSRIEVGF